MYDDYEFLKFHRDGLILTVTMDNDPLNAVNCEMHKELARVFTEIRFDTSCNVVVLTAAGRMFSAGGNLQDMLDNLDDKDSAVAELHEAPLIVQGLLSLDKPTIAKVNGHAIGLGASLALLCDIVFASETAKIGDPHVMVGLSAGDGGSLIWPQLIGYPLARHYLFTGENLTGAEAARIGLIYKALPAEELDAAVQAYAEALTQRPFTALSATKQSINMPLIRQATADFQSQIGLELASMVSVDHEEAVRAMMEKRPARFTHGRGNKAARDG